MNRYFLLVFIVILTCAQISCTSFDSKSITDSSFDNYTISEKIKLLEERVSKNPSDVEAKIALENTKHQAIIKFTRIGYSALTEGNLSGALIAYNQALEFSPNDLKLLKKIEFINREKLIYNDYEAAQIFYREKKYSKALVLLNDILKENPGHEGSLELKHKIESLVAPNVDRGPKIDLSFNKIDLPSALDFLSKNYQFNLILDQSVKDTPVTINVKDISFYKALSLILKSTNNSYKLIDEHTLLVFADAKGGRDQFSDKIIKTFYLNNADAKDISALLKGVLGISQVTINDSANSITVVDTPELIEVAADVIVNNDQPKGEVFFDVEIMEVNLSNSELLGIDYGAYQISASVPAIPFSGSISDAIRAQGAFNIPSITLSAFKQDVNAKILANPKVRVIDGEKARIHIGERVPLRSSDILDATGQTRTTFEYQDVGIRLDVESKIHNDSQVTIKIALEVSSLGENLGNSEQQVFRIGTRNAETVMLVNDGDIAILGGLIRDESRSTNTSVPRIARLLGLSWPFQNKDESENRSDILLTISPRIIRGKDKALTHLEKITQLNSDEFGLFKLKVKPINAASQLSDSADKKEFSLIYEDESSSLIRENKSLSLNSAALNIQSDSKNIFSEKADNLKSTEEKFASDPSSILRQRDLMFSQTNYSSEERVNSIVGMNLNLDIGDRIIFDLAYNSNIVDLDDIFSADSSIEIVSVDKSDDSSSVRITAQRVNEGDSESDNQVLSLQFISKRKGATFLVAKNVEVETSADGTLSLDSSNARIKIR
ncbi:hypothetical protein MAH1_31630 [Sessilibacter sp. MAH1]